jgi:hypothetical protein
LVEIGFSTLWGRLQAMFNTAYIPENVLDGWIVMEIDSNKRTKVRHMYGKDLKLIMLLQVWGECSMW